MERYYKTNRDSETRLKFKAILDRADKFNKHVEKLRKKVWIYRYLAFNILLQRLKCRHI